MHNALRITVSVLLLASAGAGAAGRSYRWTDAQGKVHFGDVPPSGASNVVETNAPLPSLGTSSTPATTNGLSADECQRKQKQLDGYQNAASITETDGLGNRREYTADERKKLIDRTQQTINDGCQSAN